MTVARKDQFDARRPPWIHAISRCVRKAFLCGGREGKYDHRRGWVEERMALLAGAFAVEVAAFAVMSNHVHLVLRMQVDAVASWSAYEVAERWLRVYPLAVAIDGTAKPVDAATVRRFSNDAEWVGKRRARLAELGWFMKALKEPLARRANREDRCRGTFWEARYTSVPLLDQAALIACMAYVDLNPVRAALADRPERSAHTAVRARITARQRHRVVTRARARSRTPAAARTLAERAGVPHAEHAAVAREPEHGLWLAPVRACVTGDVFADGRPFTVDEYLDLVDATGRVLRAGKRGRIPPELPAILSRLDLRVEDWLATMTGWRALCGGAIGAVESRVAEAARRGVSWVRSRCPLFAGRRAA